MWNKRNDDSIQPRPEPVPPRREPAPPPARDAAPSRNSAVIGPSMKIKGEISSQEELYVDGEVEGALELRHALVVGPNGKVRANIKARDAIILGSVKGNVEVSGKIAIRDKGSLIGDIRTAGISIDDGAYFKGSIDIVRPEPVRKAAESA
jgi:cytoskeletal protein CcmA (bactofilin family)